MSRRRRREATSLDSPAAPRTEFVGYEQTDVRTAITAYADLGEGYFQVKLAESPFYPAGGGQVTDAGWIEKEDGSRADLVDALRLERRPGARVLRAPASRRATACAPSCRGTSATRRWRTTRRRTSSTRCCRRCSATTSARPARPCGPTSSASTSRIPTALTRGGARRGRAARQRARLREPPVRIFETPLERGAERSAR